jgi:DNA-binding MarR family transcriptional regulator
MEKLKDNELMAWRLFIKTHAKVIEHIEQELAEEKRVPLSTYDVLIALYEAPERRLPMQQLVSKVVLSKSGLSRLIDRVQREGLIKREKSMKDKRSFYAVLTEEGEQQLRKAWPIYAKGIKRYFASSLSEEEISIFIKAFQTIQLEMDVIQSKEGQDSD